MDGGGGRLEIGGFDTCLVAGDPAYGDGGGGELVRALDALPQRMADVEELAVTGGLHKEVFSFALSVAGAGRPVEE